ncbi:carboxylesterase family [Fusarium mundagurra]|uniref:Carboxylic ester hydrolase n=1 Tax=Fusarium mundagurra TaxID=1567541 RepID=A0A8H5YU90_9HYPO|nr:carboxylesterase family [Fusarium mundagurra]
MWFKTTVLAIGIAWSLAGSKTSSRPRVTVKNGTYEGIYSPEYHQDFFLGLPYAQPPVGNLRFRVPRPLNSSFQSVHDAKAYPAACVGYGGDAMFYNELSEDCLYLNVIRPAGYQGEKLPVAFWMHGGGFFQGATQDKRYNLSFIVQQSVEIGQPIIGVSVQYRLSAWGFLLGKEVQASGQTNLGLRDQRLAMHWIQENIASFGGDPRKVTLWGESAGASSVGNHILAYNGRDDGLFRAGIMQSGGPIFYYPMTAVQKHFDSLAKLAGCDENPDKLQCLRALPFSQLNAAVNSSEDLTQRWHPVVDGSFIPARPTEMLANGSFLKVPIIVGANSDEGSIFSPRLIDTEEDFYMHLIHNTSFSHRTGKLLESPFFAAKVPIDFAKQVLEVYPDIPELGIPGVPTLAFNQRPEPRFGNQFRRSSAYYGDAIFVGPRRRTCETWAEAGLPAWCYRFNAVPAGVPPEIGSTHFQEIAFIKQNRVGGGQGYYMPPVPPFKGKPDSYTQLSKLMGMTWISFVREMDPNHWRRVKKSRALELPDSPRWPTYQKGSLEIVWDPRVDGLAYVETDTYRAAAIDLINRAAATVFDR